MTNKILGLICENLSTTPLIPKSGEHDDHIDPIATVPKKASTVSGIFVIYAATRSLDFIFNFFKNEDMFFTLLFKFFQFFVSR